jgi:hypothetical protein
VDQQPVLLRTHDVECRDRAVEGAVEIRVDHGLDARGGELRQRAIGDVRARIVDQDVEPVERLHHRRGDLRCGVLLAQIARRDQRLAARLRDPRGDRLERRATAPGQRDSASLARERERGRLTDAAARAGDPGDLAGKVLHSTLTSSCPGLTRASIDRSMTHRFQ